MDLLLQKYNLMVVLTIRDMPLKTAESPSQVVGSSSTQPFVPFLPKSVQFHNQISCMFFKNLSCSFLRLLPIFSSFSFLLFLSSTQTIATFHPNHIALLHYCNFCQFPLYIACQKISLHSFNTNLYSGILLASGYIF